MSAQYERNSLPSMCRACGVALLANNPEGTCGVCKKPVSQIAITMPDPGPDDVWVAVRTAFICNQCQMRAPLDGLHTDSTVDCPHCGLHQAFDPNRFGDAMEHAHNVGDLAGPHPEGRYSDPMTWIGDDNPHSDVGVGTLFAPEGLTRSSSSTSEQIDATRESLREKLAAGDFGDQSEIVARALQKLEHATPIIGGVRDQSAFSEASRGHPVCRKCAQPLDVQVQDWGVVTTRCPSCFEQITHQTPENARGLASSLIGVVSDEQRSGLAKANAVVTQAGVTGIACPSCGAPQTSISVGTSSGIQSCQYCHTVFSVSARDRFVGTKDIQPRIWWMLFRGDSPMRQKLVHPPLTEGDARNQALLKKFGNQGAMAKLAAKRGAEVLPVPPKKEFNWAHMVVVLIVGTLAIGVAFSILTALGFSLPLAVPAPQRALAQWVYFFGDLGWRAVGDQISPVFPALGPSSTRRSAASITSGWCSITTTVSH